MGLKNVHMHFWGHFLVFLRLNVSFGARETKEKRKGQKEKEKSA